MDVRFKTHSVLKPVEQGQRLGGACERCVAASGQRLCTFYISPL